MLHRVPVVIAELSRLRIPGENELFKRLTKASGLPEERARALLDKGFRRAARNLLEVCEEAAQSPEGVDPLRQSAYVQEADTASARVYGAFATVTGGPEGDIRRATHRAAEQARKEARAYLLQLADTNWDKYVYAVNNELAVAALLGPNGAPFDRNKVTVTFYAPDGRWSGTIAPSTSSDAPGLVCGYASIDVAAPMSWDAAPSGVFAQGFINLVTHENGAPFRVTESGKGADVLAGDFTLDRMAVRSRGVAAPLVPLPMSRIKRLTLAEMTQDGLRQLADVLVREHRYTVTYGPKKEAKGRVVGKDSSGFVKWFYPDPFGPKPKVASASKPRDSKTSVPEVKKPNLADELQNLSDDTLYTHALGHGPYRDAARAEVQRRVLQHRQIFAALNDATLADWVRLRLIGRQAWPGGAALWRLASADEIQARGVPVNRVGALNEPEGVSLERAAEALGDAYWKAETARKERERPRTPKEQAEDRIRAIRADVAAWIDSLPETPWIRSMAKSEAPKVPTDDDMDRWSGYRTTSDLNEMADTMTAELADAKVEMAKWAVRASR